MGRGVAEALADLTEKAPGLWSKWSITRATVVQCRSCDDYAATRARALAAHAAMKR